MPSKYVLFREDSDTHKEVYYVGEGARNAGRQQTDDPAKAMRFESLRAAYGHGAQMGMLYWKAGER